MRQVRGGAAERAPRKRKRDTRVRALRRAATTKRKRKEQEKHPSISGAFCWCGHRDLNSDGVNHTPLKRTRLPVPPWPHSENSASEHFCQRFCGRFVKKISRKNLCKVFLRKRGEERGDKSSRMRVSEARARREKAEKKKSEAGASDFF